MKVYIKHNLEKFQDEK